MNEKYYTVPVVYSGGFKTINELANEADSPIKGFKDNINELIFYQDKETGRDNAQNIYSMYYEDDGGALIEQYINSFAIDGDAPILSGTILMIPSDKANMELVAIQGSDLYLKQQDFKSFISDELKRIQDDPLYVRENRIESNSGNSDINIIQQSCQVWIYIASLQKIVDVTNFIQQVGINKSKEMGTFSISLAPLSSDSEVISSISGDTINYFNSDFESVNDPGVKKIGLPFFSKYIQQNDLVFIRFEKLENEIDRGEDFYSTYSYNGIFDVSPTNLPNAIWDMMGLVDENEYSYNAVINSFNINISGRDFTKVLTDDASYFYPYALFEGSENFFISQNEDNKYFKRCFVSSEFKNLFAYGFRKIRDTLGFIFNQLTNVGAMSARESEILFTPYGESRSSTYQVNGANQNVLDKVEQNGIWQIIKLLVDDKLDDRRIVDSSISNPQGSLMSLVNKSCQEPFVEFWGDTYGAFFNFIARQPPFTFSQIIDYLTNELVVEVDGRDVSNFNVKWETETYCVYQIEPIGGLFGTDTFSALSKMPIVYFPEFINYFGNKKLTIPDNYISWSAFSNSKRAKNENTYKNGLINDLKYLIESTIYLPFTRRGSFTIKGGDRRIRRGNWIRLNFTGEIVYVDSVSNSLVSSNNNIDRDTVVNFSRGMMEKNLKGDSQSDGSNVGDSLGFGQGDGGYLPAFSIDTENDNQSKGKFNYEDIVNIDVVGKLLSAGLSGTQNTQTFKEESNNIVNEDAFNYFFNRIQMKQFY